MALGDLICEYAGKITSVKILPFEDSGADVRYEVTQTIRLSGKLAGGGFGSNYVRQSPDGTSVTKFYGIWTTENGYSIRAEFGGNAVPLGSGRASFRTTGMLKSGEPSLAWLTSQSLAFEGEGDFNTMEVTGKVYLWS